MLGVDRRCDQASRLPIGTLLRGGGRARAGASAAFEFGRCLDCRFAVDDAVILTRGDEGVECRIDTLCDAKDGVDGAGSVGVEERVGVVTSIMDDDIALGEVLEMSECREAFMSVAEECEIDWHPVAESAPGADEALWMGTIMWGLVSIVDEGSRQIDLASIDGEGSVSFPCGGPHRFVVASEQFLVE